MPTTRRRRLGKTFSMRVDFKTLAGVYDLSKTVGFWNPEIGTGPLIRCALEVMLAEVRRQGLIPDYEDELSAWERIKAHHPNDIWVGAIELQEGLALSPPAEASLTGAKFEWPDTQSPAEQKLRGLLEQTAADMERQHMDGLLERVTSLRGVRDGVEQPTLPIRPATRVAPWEGLDRPNPERLATFLTTRKGAASEIASLLAIVGADETGLLRRAVDAALGSMPPGVWHEPSMLRVVNSYKEAFERWNREKGEQDATPTNVPD